MPEYRYKFNKQVTISQRTDKGVVVLCPNPLRVVKLSLAAARLLENCPDWTTPWQLADKLQLEPKLVSKTLAELATRNLLNYQAVPLSNRENLPTVTVVVPVRNRPRDIELCVKSLRALDYPAEKLEIIIVDDASTDETPEVVKNLPVDQAVCLTDWRGAAACRNLGASLAKGEIIAYTDSDCEVEPGWLLELVGYFDEPKTAIVGGRVDSFSLDTVIERYESVASSLYMGLEERECRPNTAIPFLPTANLLIRREVWQKLNGFDPAFPIGEDVDLVWRTCAAGYRVQYVPRGVVRHKYRSKLGRFLKRKAFYGGSETFLLRKHPAQRKLFYIPRQRLPLVVALVVGLVWHWALLVALLVPLLESWFRQRQLYRFGGKVNYWQVVIATLHNYNALMLHLFGNIARYYGLPLLLAGLVWQPLLLAGLVCFSYPAFHTYFSRRPPLVLPLFVGLYWLELAAHQIGMLGRCLECATLQPMIPALKVKG